MNSVYSAEYLRGELRDRIKRSGLSQYEYARRAKVYPTQLTNFLSGQRDSTGHALLKHLGYERVIRFSKVARKRGKKAAKRG